MYVYINKIMYSYKSIYQLVAHQSFHSLYILSFVNQCRQTTRRMPINLSVGPCRQTASKIQDAGMEGAERGGVGWGWNTKFRKTAVIVFVLFLERLKTT